jgi:DNA-directed RNA polymerase subunit RPC12/RpoP
MKVWWLCKKCAQSWRATVNSRVRGNGCPYCSGKKASEHNCLQTNNPALANEWHPTQNGNLSPKDVTPNSGKKVWWICKKKGHEWPARISDRNKGTGCPYCSGRYATKENNLQKVNPKLAKEWHPTKNGHLTPKDVLPNSGKKAWWICKKKGHEWEAIVSNRNRRGDGCPYCSGRRK